MAIEVVLLLLLFRAGMIVFISRGKGYGLECRGSRSSWWRLRRCASIQMYEPAPQICDLPWHEERDEDEDEGDMAVPKLGGQAAVAKVESSTVADIQYLLTLSPGLADTIKNVPELAPAVQQALTARTAPTKPKPDTFRVAMNGAVFDLPLDSTTEDTVAALRKQYQSAMRVISPRSPRIIGFTVDDIPEDAG